MAVLEGTKSHSGLSVIIVNYNTRELTRQCLASLINTTSELDAQIIVVDNASQDESIATLRNEFPGVQTIENKVNRGFAAACNQGIHQATGHFILLLNSDTIIQPHAITKSINFMLAHPRVGILGCKLLNADGSLQRSCSAFLGFTNLLAVNLFLYKLFPKSRLFGHDPYLTYFDHDRIVAVEVVMGAFMLVRREMLDQIGGLDERFFMYAEEVDLCLRARRSGWDTVFFPEAEIIHLQGAAAALQSARSYLMLHESLHLYFDKHFNDAKAMLLKVILFFGSLLRWTIWSLVVGRASPSPVASDHAKRHIYRRAICWYLSSRNKRRVLVHENLDR